LISYVADWYHEQSVHREAPGTMLHNTPLTLHSPLFGGVFSAGYEYEMRHYSLRMMVRIFNKFKVYMYCYSVDERR
ncbi:TPA: hypothetical protein ACV184_005342, partial [Escherichia coli]